MKAYSGKEKITATLGFIFISGIFYGIWLVISFFINILAAVDPRISAGIIGAMITAFVGLAAMIITQRQIKMREIDESHRTKKVEIYQKFIGTVTSMIAGQNGTLTIKSPTEQELADSLFSYKTEILLWGSPKVIKAQLEFERTATLGGNSLKSVDNLYKAIREDIGLSNAGLNNLEFIKLFLIDPDEVDRV
jgi:hypothetical protein